MPQPHQSEHVDPPCPFPCARDEQMKKLQMRMDRTEQMLEMLMRKAGMEPPPMPEEDTPPILQHA